MATKGSWAKGRLTLEIETDKRPLPRQQRVWPLPPFGSGADPLIAVSVFGNPGPYNIGTSSILVSIPELPVDSFGTSWVLEHAFYTGSLPDAPAWEYWAQPTGQAQALTFNLPQAGTHLFRLVLIGQDAKRKPYPYASASITAGMAPGVVTAPTGVTIAVSNTRPA